MNQEDRRAIIDEKVIFMLNSTCFYMFSHQNWSNNYVIQKIEITSWQILHGHAVHQYYIKPVPVYIRRRQLLVLFILNELNPNWLFIKQTLLMIICNLQGSKS